MKLKLLAVMFFPLLMTTVAKADLTLEQFMSEKGVIRFTPQSLNKGKLKALSVPVFGDPDPTLTWGVAICNTTVLTVHRPFLNCVTHLSAPFKVKSTDREINISQLTPIDFNHQDLQIIDSSSKMSKYQVFIKVLRNNSFFNNNIYDTVVLKQKISLANLMSDIYRGQQTQHLSKDEVLFNVDAQVLGMKLMPKDLHDLLSKLTLRTSLNAFDPGIVTNLINLPMSAHKMDFQLDVELCRVRSLNFNKCLTKKSRIVTTTEGSGELTISNLEPVLIDTTDADPIDASLGVDQYELTFKLIKINTGRPDTAYATKTIKVMDLIKEESQSLNLKFLGHSQTDVNLTIALTGESIPNGKSAGANNGPEQPALQNEKLEKAKQLAYAMMEKAQTSQSDISSSTVPLSRMNKATTYRGLVEELKVAVHHVELHPPYGRGLDWSGCSQWVLAYTMEGTRTNDQGEQTPYVSGIYMCHWGFDDRDVQHMAETLVHEYTHAGTQLAAEYKSSSDECFESWTEVMTVLRSGYKPFENGYIEKCGPEVRKLFNM